MAEADTDSGLKRLWEVAEAAEDWSAMESLRRRWDEVMNRKVRGELTDATRTDAVRRVVSDVFRHKTSFRLECRECMELKGPGPARLWEVWAYYDGDPSDASVARWDEAMPHVEDGLKAMEFIDRERSRKGVGQGPRGEEQWTCDQWDAGERLPWAVWAVDVRVWAGPPARVRRPRKPRHSTACVVLALLVIIFILGMCSGLTTHPR